jgi:protein TonB
MVKERHQTWKPAELHQFFQEVFALNLNSNLIASVFLHILILILLFRTASAPPEVHRDRPLIARIVELPRVNEQKTVTGKPEETKREVTPFPEDTAEQETKREEVSKKQPQIKKESKKRKEVSRKVPKKEDTPSKDLSHDIEEDRTPQEMTTTVTPKEHGDAVVNEVSEGGTDPSSASITTEAGESVMSGPLTERKPVLPQGKELFDSEIIDNIAKREYSEQERKKSGLTFDTKELKNYSYMMKLKQRIESIWIYPRESARRGVYGDLYIRFTIKKDGHLGAVELMRTSGYRELDNAAIEALREGDPYWPLPKNWKVEALTVEGHFIYSLFGTYLR